MAGTGTVRSYSGAWRTQQQYADRALALAPGVDPSHRLPDPLDAQVRPPSGAPTMDLAPLYMTERPDASYLAEVDVPGIILDAEPITHEEEISYPVPSPLHAVDRGRVAHDTFNHPAMRASDERYTTERPETVPITGDLTVAVLRGDNSLPQNNPDGYRYGFYVKRWVERTAFPTRGMWRRYDERALRHMTAARGAQSPTPDHPNRYTSPFSWNKRAITHALQRPIQRRNPPPWDESVLAEPPTGEESYIDYVIG